MSGVGSIGNLRVGRDYRCRSCQLLGTMIPHAAVSLAGAVGALVVTMIGASLVAGPVLSARLAGCPHPAQVTACLAAVDVTVIAPAVYPELAAAVPAES